MTSIYLPTPLFLILRKLFNAFSVFSISRGYLVSRLSGKIEARASGERRDEPLDSVNETITRGAEDKVEERKEGKENELPPPKDSTDHDESSCSLLDRLKKALPPKEQKSNDSGYEKEKDTVAELRRRHLQDLAMKPPLPDSAPPIYRLIHNPQLFDPVRAPRHPIVLCHGLYGFDVRGPEAFPKLRMHYWSNVLHVLRKKVGAEVIVTGVPGTGSIVSRAERMDRFLKENVPGREINFMAHSMGGLDCRHLITHIQPKEYRPISLTSLSVPHRGSPFMDWCLANIGIGSPRPFPFPSSSSSSSSLSQNNVPGAANLDAQATAAAGVAGAAGAAGAAMPLPRVAKNNIPYSLRAPLLSRPEPSTQDGTASFTLSMIPSNLTAMVLSLIDSPAYANLTTVFLRDLFNPSTPDRPDVKYFSVAARTAQMGIWHPLWLPKLIVDAAEEQEAYNRHNRQDDNISSSSPSQIVSPRSPIPPGGAPSLDRVGQDLASASAGDPHPHSLRGNDGLVTISSAKWGEFLGIIEGCDHWELRGARGLGADWEEGWGGMWRDWIGKWRDSGTNEGDDMLSFLRGRIGQGLGVGNANVEPAAATTATNVSEDMRKNNVNGGHDHWVTKNGLAGKFDLERFYVALSRKLYDEGL